MVAREKWVPRRIDVEDCGGVEIGIRLGRLASQDFKIGQRRRKPLPGEKRYPAWVRLLRTVGRKKWISKERRFGRIVRKGRGATFRASIRRVVVITDFHEPRTGRDTPACPPGSVRGLGNPGNNFPDRLLRREIGV